MCHRCFLLPASRRPHAWCSPHASHMRVLPAHSPDAPPQLLLLLPSMRPADPCGCSHASSPSRDPRDPSGPCCPCGIIRANAMLPVACMHAPSCPHPWPPLDGTTQPTPAGQPLTLARLSCASHVRRVGRSVEFAVYYFASTFEVRSRGTRHFAGHALLRAGYGPNTMAVRAGGASEVRFTRMRRERGR